MALIYIYPLFVRKDPQLPSGWRYYDNGRGAIFFRDSEGTRFSSRRRALAHMYKVGGFTKEAIYYIRDGLLDEGWFYHQDLPPSWMYKLYNHKIEVCSNIFSCLIIIFTFISGSQHRHPLHPFSWRHHLQVQDQDQETGTGAWPN